MGPGGKGKEALRSREGGQSTKGAVRGDWPGPLSLPASRPQAHSARAETRQMQAGRQQREGRESPTWLRSKHPTTCGPSSTWAWPGTLPGGQSPTSPGALTPPGSWRTPQTAGTLPLFPPVPGGRPWRRKCQKRAIPQEGPASNKQTEKQDFQLGAEQGTAAGQGSGQRDASAHRVLHAHSDTPGRRVNTATEHEPTILGTTHSCSYHYVGEVTKVLNTIRNLPPTVGDYAISSDLTHACKPRPHTGQNSLPVSTRDSGSSGGQHRPPHLGSRRPPREGAP